MGKDRGRAVKEKTGMSRTMEVINKLPQDILKTVKGYKEQYNNPANKTCEVRARMAGYVQGLRDAGVISERERQVVFVYMTV